MTPLGLHWQGYCGTAVRPRTCERQRSSHCTCCGRHVARNRWVRVTVGLRVIHLVEKSKMWESKRNFLIRARSCWAPARENKLVGRVCTCVGVCVGGSFLYLWETDPGPEHRGGTAAHPPKDLHTGTRGCVESQGMCHPKFPPGGEKLI